MIARLPRALKDMLIRVGFPLRLNTDDRRTLEAVILPCFAARTDVRRGLFVGCDWYTAWYGKLFERAEYWTLEVDPARRIYGAPRHVVDAVENIADHFAPQSLDVIFCNGVFGWGLDDPEKIQQAFAGFASCLRVGGTMVLGWNDIPAHKPFSPEICADLFFERMTFPPLNAWRYRSSNPNAHTFDFYVVSRN